MPESAQSPDPTSLPPAARGTDPVSLSAPGACGRGESRGIPGSGSGEGAGEHGAGQAGPRHDGGGGGGGGAAAGACRGEGGSGERAGQVRGAMREGGGPEDLRRALAKGRYQILHFMGHGLSDSGQGSLVFSTSSGHPG